MAQFTKKAIIESFIKLINLHPLEKITVKDIVEDCGVNRNTFYYYFQDIYALVDELFNNETERILSSVQDFASWTEGFGESARFAMENKKAVEHIYNSISRERLERYFDRTIGEVILARVRLEGQGLALQEEDVRLIAQFYQCALTGLIERWIREGMKENTKDMAASLEAIFRGNLRRALENAAEYAKK